MQLPVLRYENAAVCQACGGACCHAMPGCASPADFGAPDRATMVSRLGAAFATGRWTIDWWEGDPRTGSKRRRVRRAYFVRPATVLQVGELLDPSYGGCCTFLRLTGCELAHDARPLECRMLEPNPNRVRDGGCISHGGGKHEMAIEWLEYADVLRRFIRQARAA